MTRIYKKHGQITTVTRDTTWNHLIVDCGSYWLKHNIWRGTFQEGRYDSLGYFTSLTHISRERFKQNMKLALQHLIRL